MNLTAKAFHKDNQAVDNTSPKVATMEAIVITNEIHSILFTPLSNHSKALNYNTNKHTNC